MDKQKPFRKFKYLMVGNILRELKDEDDLMLTRVTFYRLEKSIPFPPPHRTVGKWRTYTREEADTVKRLIKENYNL